MRVRERDRVGLRRLMVKLGVSQEQSKALMATGTPVQTPRATTVGGQPVVQIAEPFDRVAPAAGGGSAASRSTSSAPKHSMAFSLSTHLAFQS